MPLWTKTSPPNWVPNAVATESGWMDPVTKEVYVAIGQLAEASFAVINKITLGSTKKTYKLGDTFSVKVKFSEEVNVTGTPRIALTLGSASRYANYSAGTGTSVLTFSYTITTGDDAVAGEVEVGTSIDLNSGTIVDTLGAHHAAALAEFTAPSTATHVVDATAPTISTVTGFGTSHKIGDVMNLSVKFAEAVVVTGTPVFTLHVNATTKNASYVSGTGTDTLVFRYTVAAEDSATAGQFTFGTISGGTIKDAAGNAADLTVPETDTSNVVIDGVVPTISSVTGLAASYVTDDSVDATLKFSENVAVTGSPTLTININTTARTATYKSGTGTTDLVFEYTPVVAEDVATAGQFSLGAVDLAGGTIKDAAGNAADLTVPETDTSTITVN